MDGTQRVIFGTANLVKVVMSITHLFCRHPLLYWIYLLVDSCGESKMYSFFLFMKGIHLVDEFSLRSKILRIKMI